MNKRKLRINILLYSPTLGGGDRVTSIYAGYLKRQGHDVFVTSAKPHRLGWKNQLRSILRNGRLLQTGMTTAHYDRAGVPVRFSGSRSISDNDLPDADVVIATFWPTAEWAANLSLTKGEKIYFGQGYESHFPFASPTRVDTTYRLPMSKIVISRWLDAIMREKFGAEPVARIPNSVDTLLFYAPERQMNATPCVGFLYGDSHNKGVDITLKAIEHIRLALPNLKVIAFGASELQKNLPLPPNAEFHFKPAQDRIRNLYAQCDVWMCGSRLEGFHLPPLEAMACRCPVVSTAVGGPEDLIENGRQGYLVPIEDAKGLAEKTLSILQGGAEAWRRMSDAAYETATGYTWDEAGALFERALFSVVDNHRRSGKLAADS